MDDCMAFPDTVEEFMEQYKIIDTEQVYTNGAELVPIFRMKQWFEHLSPAQPERKGKFIGTEYDGYADGNPVYYEWKCSSCGCVFEDEEPTYNYCPNCGADMRGEQE